MEEQKRIVYLGSETEFYGDIETSELILEGSMEGNVYALRRVTLVNGSSLIGDINTLKLVVEEGSFYQGRIELGEAGPKEVLARKQGTWPSRERPSDSAKQVEKIKNDEDRDSRARELGTESKAGLW